MLTFLARIYAVVRSGFYFVLRFFARLELDGDVDEGVRPGRVDAFEFRRFSFHFYFWFLCSRFGVSLGGYFRLFRPEFSVLRNHLDYCRPGN